jgi:hypothetical protein
MRETKGSIRVVSVSVDRSGEWSSLEKEINDLLPLFFSEESWLVVSSFDTPEYLATVKAREREYLDGWRTRRSLSVEVRIWAVCDEIDGTLPLSAGRSFVEGTRSFASSAALSDMLRRAVKNAVNGLPDVKPSGAEFSFDGGLN